MSLLDRLFGKSAPSPLPDITFGRYTDTYKTPEQYRHWEEALKAFEREDYMGAYRAFFQYLRDERQDNVRVEETEKGLAFELYQGSMKVSGTADLEHLRAEARIAHIETMNIGFLRRLVDQNYDLKYARYALDNENNISIVFDTYTLDGSPFKIYYGLKEMATNADKQDDLLLDEFATLLPTDMEQLRPISEELKEIKYHYIQEEIANVFTLLDSGKPDPQKHPAAVAYLLLNLCYKLDFLTKPEGYMMEALERIHRLFFAKDERNAIQKTQLLRKEIAKLQARSKEDFFKEMYQAPATFGITSPVDQERVAALIDGELPAMDWFIDNGHPEVALSISGYIVGFSLFNYALPKPCRELFLLYFQITEREYFQALGFQTAFDKKFVQQQIKKIVEDNEDEYPKLNPRTRILDYSGLPQFARSFLRMVRELDLTKQKN
jgi:hypothetical protein